ncbi:hypothetical protein KC887_07470 [Candidatus Kaiserbacteria bacterium]|nr:hypothetical protein [Candidatus Kaiserbacteria bacterium]
MKDVSEITIDQSKGLWNEVMSREFPSSGRVYKLKEKGDVPERVLLMSGVERLCIQFDGKIWADSDMKPLSLDPERIKIFFLREGFDIRVSRSKYPFQEE